MDYRKIAQNWETYDYEEAVFNDVKEYLLDNMDNFVDSDTESIEDIRDSANDEMWTADSVTGIGSGSYTFSRIMAEFYLIGNSDLYEQCLEDLGGKYDAEPEHRDVSIRCYLLMGAIDRALEDDEVIAAFNTAKEG